jgi:DNA repair exonuclease SbcCD ATPase subunit
MLRNPGIEKQLSAFRDMLAECSDLKSRVETERNTVSAVTAALVHTNEELAQRGLLPRQRAEGLASSMEENALDLRATLDEVDASICAAIAPMEAFAKATERIGLAQEEARRAAEDAAESAQAEIERIESVLAQHSELCERLLDGFRELADAASRTLDDLREKIDRLQNAFGEIVAAMSQPCPGIRR